jgi:hypothetical protein
LLLWPSLKTACLRPLCILPLYNASILAGKGYLKRLDAYISYGSWS